MKRLFGLGLALALVVITACVGDRSVDPNAKPDAGADTDTGTSSSGAPNAGGLLCGLITETAYPSCPGTGPSDPNCSDDTATACCPGSKCVKDDDQKTACPGPSQSKPFQCFAGQHCNDGKPFQSRCCVPGQIVDAPDKNGCGEPKRLTIDKTANTTCQQTCAGGSVQLCRPGDSDELACPNGTTCQRTIIAIPNPNGDAFLRAVGVCR